MVKSITKTIKRKRYYLEVDVLYEDLLTEEGYDPVYGARPLRRAVMRLLEDTLAQECLTTPLYPKQNLIVTRKERERSLGDYSNEVMLKLIMSC